MRQNAFKQEDHQPRKLYLRALVGRARIYQFTGDYIRSQKDWETLRRLAHDPQHVYEYYQGLSSLYERRGQFRPAYAWLKKAIYLCRRHPGMINEKMVKNNQIHLLIEKGEYARALKLGRSLLRQIKPGKPVRGSDRNFLPARDRAKLLTSIGNAHLALGNYDQARDFFLRARRLNCQQNNLEGLSVTDNNLTLVYWKKGNYQKALACSQDALAVRERIGHRYGISATLNNLGLINDEMGNYQIALQYYERALDIFRQLNDIYGMTIALTNIGSIYSEVEGNMTKAMSYYRHSLELVRQTGDAYGEIEAMLTMADMHYQQRDWSTFEDLVTSAGRLLRSVASEELTVTYYLALIRMYTRRQKYEQRRTMMRRLIRFLAHSADELLRFETVAALIDFLHKEPAGVSWKEIGGLVREIEKKFKIVESPLKRAKILRGLVKYHLATGDRRRAARHFRQWADTAPRYGIKAHFPEIEHIRPILREPAASIPSRS